MDKGFDVHKLDAGKASSSPGTLQDQCRAAVLGKTGVEKSEDIREKLNLPKPLIDFLTKSFGTKDFHINKDDVTAEDIAAETYKATCVLNKQSVILKCVPNSVLSEDNQVKIQKWRSKGIPNIQKCVVSFQEGHKEIFVLEDCGAGLDEIIKHCKSKDRQVNEESVWLFVKKFSEVMIKFQEKDFKYEDLKLEKICIDKDGDISLSSPIRFLNTEENNNQFAMSDSGSSAIYSPPETIIGEGVTDKSDVWVLGAIIYELAMLKPAYAISESDDYFSSVNKVVEGNKPDKLSEAFSSDLQSTIWSCLDVDTTQRPSWESLLQTAEAKCDGKSADLKAWLPA